MTQRLRKPLVELIEDVNVRESLQWIYEYLTQLPVARSEFEHFTVTFRGAVIGERIPHRLGFTPSDIFITSVIPSSETVTILYQDTNESSIAITSTGECVVRFFAGRHENEL